MGWCFTPQPILLGTGTDTFATCSWAGWSWWGSAESAEFLVELSSQQDSLDILCMRDRDLCHLHMYET